METQIITHRWSTKIQNYNSEFQAELLALQKAIDYATTIPQQPITTLVDNQASVLAVDNPKSTNPVARTICRNVIEFQHIQVSWIKVHVGYDGNEQADRLAKEAAESNTKQYQTEVPNCHLKSILKQKMVQEY
ncbi:hypothetical protein AVEN_49869-1 [Araneus ventricosus]|uniref:RNase H type-1 domain-containing protein n=1 Tax=Araneus ventricosus TaxID=182803 RepID=A0A4Y2P099_ARAVE|nr:hypothetical protein AVEN_49869-1 [Araneus ventricosus]